MGGFGVCVLLRARVCVCESWTKVGVYLSREADELSRHKTSPICGDQSRYWAGPGMNHSSLFISDLKLCKFQQIRFSRLHLQQRQHKVL